VNVKTDFAKKIRLLGFVLVGGIFCWSCATKATVREEPVPSAAPNFEAATAVKESPPAPPEPAPLPKTEPPPAPVPAAPVRQDPPPFPPAVKETKPQEIFFMHTVKWSGETLSIIALWYTGDQSNWKTIVQANPGLNPNRIFGGNEILIPEKMMKTHDPLPKEYVNRFYSRAKKEKPKTQEEEPKLFGPKKSSK
jgi:nucleoid-associated protein YgaU